MSLFRPWSDPPRQYLSGWLLVATTALAACSTTNDAVVEDDVPVLARPKLSVLSLRTARPGAANVLGDDDGGNPSEACVALEEPGRALLGVSVENFGLVPLGRLCTGYCGQVDVTVVDSQGKKVRTLGIQERFELDLSGLAPGPATLSARLITMEREDNEDRTSAFVVVGFDASETADGQKVVCDDCDVEFALAEVCGSNETTPDGGNPNADGGLDAATPDGGREAGVETDARAAVDSSTEAGPNHDVPVAVDPAAQDSAVAQGSPSVSPPKRDGALPADGGPSR